MDEAVGDGVVLAAVDAAMARCHALASAPDVGSLLALTRALADLVPAVQVAQARVLAGLEVHEAAEFGPHAIPGPLGEAGTVPGPDAVTRTRSPPISGCPPTRPAPPSPWQPR